MVENCKHPRFALPACLQPPNAAPQRRSSSTVDNASPRIKAFSDFTAELDSLSINRCGECRQNQGLKPQPRNDCTLTRVKRLSLKKLDFLKQKEMELAQLWPPEATPLRCSSRKVLLVD